MEHILTLITDRQTFRLDEKTINKAIIAIEKKGGKILNFSILAKDKACDVTFTGTNHDIIRQALTENLTELPVDFSVQENRPNRRRKMLISDMDSTIIREECIDEIAAKLGIKEKVAAITARAMNGELDFEAALEERVALLAGLGADELEDVYKNHLSLAPGAKQLVHTMRKNGSFCILVSGGFTFFTEKIAKDAGFHEHRANILQVESGKLTGKVAYPILGSEAKLASLKEQARRLDITEEDVIAAGDGANDLPMLQAAGLGVACHAKPAVRAAVGVAINHTGLDSLLYMQGYKEKEIIESGAGEGIVIANDQRE